MLWPFVRAARQGDLQHPSTRVSAYLKGDKIIINKQSYSTDQIEKLPGFIHYNLEHPPATKTSDRVTIFFTKESPFSNFHPCDLSIDGIDYSSVEQYLCHQKALLFDSAQVAAEMLYIEDPKLLKQRAKNLAKFDRETWITKVGDMLKVALMAKFTQNTALKDALLATGDKTLGEACTHDLLFGIGLSMQNPNAMDPTRWRGGNLQGITLMHVRTEI